MSSEEINALFHRLWTKAASQPNYDKDEWQHLVKLLAERGIYL